jgi:hypothetical protein
MLSEAVRLMGAVGGGSPAPRPLRPPPPSTSFTPSPPVQREAPVEPRPRLRLTPSSLDAAPEPAPESAPEPTAEPAAREEEGWTWRELLSSVDGDEPRSTKRARPGAFTDTIAGLGIDADALLPQSRLDEIAPILQTGDHAGAREIVRRLAPVAMRRLSRSILTTPAMREEATAFKSRLESQLDEAAAKDREGIAIGALLATPEGRAFLLVDAAVGDT